MEGSDNKLMEVRSVFEYDCSWIGGGRLWVEGAVNKLMEVRSVFEYDCSWIGGEQIVCGRFRQQVDGGQGCV